MEKLLNVDDVAEALQVSRRTAYAIMHQMPHLQRPFRVAEGALRAWMAQRTAGPDGRQTREEAPRPRLRARPYAQPVTHIPRRRA